jgi:hypothetical protein
MAMLATFHASERQGFPQRAELFSTSKVVPLLRRLVAGFPLLLLGFEATSSHVGFVLDKVALRQVFSDDFGFSYQFSFHRLLHIHHHRHQLSSGAGTIGQLVADVYQVDSVSPHPKKLTSVDLSGKTICPEVIRPLVSFTLVPFTLIA